MPFDHAVIMVSDLEQSLGWYAAVLGALGFEKTRDHVWVNEAGQALDLKQAEELHQSYLRRGVGLNHIAFRVPDAAALARVAAEVRAAGYDVPETQTHGADRAIFFKDRDGMRVEVICYG